MMKLEINLNSFHPESFSFLDVEGKEIDTYVVKKLLSYYPEYFRKKVLGRDLRITLRVPNPMVEMLKPRFFFRRWRVSPVHTMQPGCFTIAALFPYSK